MSQLFGTHGITALQLRAGVLGGGAALGMVASEALPAIIRLAILGSLLGLLALDVILFSTVRLPAWLVGASIVGMALANGELAISPIMEYGRFIPPVVLFAALVWLGAGESASHRSRFVLRACVLGMLLVSLSLLTSIDSKATLEKSLALAVVVTGVYAALRWSSTHRSDLSPAVFFAFALLVLTNVAMLIIGGDVYTGNRFRGWTINPNNLGIICAFAVPLAVSEAMLRRGSRRALALAVLAAAALMLLQSGSRASTLGALLGLAAVLRISQVSRSLVFVGSFLALLIFAPLAVRTATNADLLTSVDRQGASGREQVWSIAIAETQEKPFLGAGFSTTEKRFEQEEFGVFEEFRGGYFHNSYLEAAVELGVLAGVLLTAVGLFALSHLVRRVEVQNAWAAGMAVSGAVVATFETGLITPGSVLMFPFWIAVGVLTIHRVSPMYGEAPGITVNQRGLASSEAGP